MKKDKIKFIDNFELFSINYRFLEIREVNDKKENQRSVKLEISAYKTNSYDQYGFYKNISKLI